MLFIEFLTMYPIGFMVWRKRIKTLPDWLACWILFSLSARRILLYLFRIVSGESSTLWHCTEYLLLPMEEVASLLRFLINIGISNIGWESRWSNIHTLILSLAVLWNMISWIHEVWNICQEMHEWFKKLENYCQFRWPIFRWI